MKNDIQNKLAAIEAAYNIQILYAAESGSRAWGFPSPDSDYDVRFIYIKPLDNYLSVPEQADDITLPIVDELDIYGWDLRKVCLLTLKSNVTPFEWIQSPIIYREQSGFKAFFWEVCQEYFNPKKNAFHYLGLVKGFVSGMEDADEITIKKLFYIIRSLLAAKWCVEKNQIAPMNIQPLLQLLPDDILVLVEGLMKEKETASEGFLVKVDPVLQRYIETETAICLAGADQLTKQSFEPDVLDSLFRQLVKRGFK